MTIWYSFYTDEQGFVGDVSVEVDDDATEEDIVDYITEDLNFRQEEEAWENDRVSGEYRGDIFFPYED